jgi:hypothetical protein
VRAQHRKAELLGELAPQVLDDDLVGAAAARLALDVRQLVAEVSSPPEYASTILRGADGIASGPSLIGVVVSLEF